MRRMEFTYREVPWLALPSAGLVVLLLKLFQSALFGR